MRILLINVRLDSGSVGRIVRDLYKGIKANGHDCKIAYARGGISDIPRKDTIRICSEFEVKKHALLTRLFGRTAFYSHHSTMKFLKKVDKYKPDVVHIHGLYGYYINMKDLFLFLKRKNIKLISTLHSCWDFTGHCCYFDYIGCEQWKTTCSKCKQKSSYPKSSLLENTKLNYVRKRKLYNCLADCVIITPSEWMEDLAKKSFLRNHIIKTIKNGIDINVFRALDSINIPYRIDLSKPTILCIASIWEKRKGWNDVVALSKIVSYKDIQLIVVGVDKRKKAMLDSRTITIQKTNNVQELCQLYNVATVLFNPTYEDNYPTVNLEAIACGTPVITYNTGGSPEAIKQFDMGEIIEKRDFQTLIKCTKYYYYHHDNELDVIRKQLSFDRMTAEYISAYQSIKNGGKNA